MTRKFAIGAGAWLMCLLVGNFALGQVPFTSTLSGGQETPPNASPGTGTATGTLTGGPGAFVFTYSGSFSGLLSNVIDAHIHEAPPGVPGGIVHPLDMFTTGATAGTFSGDWRFDDPVNPLSDARAAALLANNTYFNIHTVQFPGGEIRGQILVVPEPAALGLASIGLLALVRRRR